MKPQEQLRKEPNGDCLRACIASLLEIPCDKVPDFTQAPPVPEDSPYPAFWLALQSWLADKGFWLLEMQLPANLPFMPIPLPALCIFFGETAKGYKHAIVGRIEGGEFFPVWNPWPEAELASGVGAIGFLLPRDPATFVNMGRALSRIRKSASGMFGPVAQSITLDAAQALGLDTANAHDVIAQAIQDAGNG